VAEINIVLFLIIDNNKTVLYNVYNGYDGEK